MARMKGRIGYWIAAGVVLLAVLTMWFGMARPRPAPQPEPEGGKARPPSDEQDKLDKLQIEFEGLSLTEFDDKGGLLWKVRSHGKLAVDRQRQLATGTDIDWELTRGKNDHLRVRAPEFVIDWGGKEIRFTEGVQAESNVKDITFRCGALRYDMGTRRLLASETVEGTFGGYTGRADKADVDLRADMARLLGAVTVKQGPYTASAGELAVNLKARTAQAAGSPKFSGAGWEVQASKVILDPAAGIAKASGGVRGTQGKQKVRCDRLVVSGKGKRAELRGRVRLSAPKFEAQAEALDIDVDSGTATFPRGVKAKTKVLM